jgi:hypothetical protein
MPYKDPAQQREYLRNWRRMQRLRTAAQHTQHAPLPLLSQVSPLSRQSVQHVPTSHLAVRWKRGIPSIPLKMPPPAIDQRALKTSPDGVLQTGREATRVYQMARGQLSTPRPSPRSAPTRRPATPLIERRSRYVAMPVAALLVEVLSRLF